MKLDRYIKNVYALDLGTTKFCLVRIKSNKDGPHQVETVSVPAAGMRRGMIANRDEAGRALTELIDRAEDTFQRPIGRVVVGVSGNHLQGKIVRSELDLNEQVIDRTHLANLSTKAEAGLSNSDLELLHLIPIGYKIDQRDALESPLGFSGKGLKAAFFSILADKYYLRDMVELCNSCGIQITNLFAEPLASASVTVPDDFKLRGTFAVDVGGGTADGIIFHAGKPCALFTVDIGGLAFTNDLAVGLHLPKEQAEKVKLRFGLKPLRADETLRVADFQGRQNTITFPQVSAILAPRMRELAVHLAKYALPHKKRLKAGIILTGGGSELRGIDQYLQKSLGILVNKHRPTTSIIDLDESLQLGQQSFPSRTATGLGLLNLVLAQKLEHERLQPSGFSKRTLSSFVNWLKEMT